MKKINFTKLFRVLIFLVIFIEIFSIISYGDTENPPPTQTTRIVTAMGGSGASAGDPTNNSSIMYLLSRVFTLIQFIGTGVSIIAVTKLGITYLLASVEEKADIKKKAWPIVIGSIFIVATVNIMATIQKLVSESLGSDGTGIKVEN